MSADAMNMIRSIASKLAGLMPPEMAIGRARTTQILNILLPTMLPTKRSDSPFLAAVMVVISSGRDVPKAITVREMMRSEIPIEVAIVEAELTTSSLPAMTPARPSPVKTNDFIRLYLGFSTILASFLSFWAREIK